MIGHGRYIATGLTHLDLETGQGRPAQFWTYGAHAVEIEVDTETGEVEVLKVATALDAGKVLNPLQCRGQVVGGVVQGLGSALWEGFLFSEDGRAPERLVHRLQDPDRERRPARDPADLHRDPSAGRPLRRARRRRAPR